jgi:hypothetical protein
MPVSQLNQLVLSRSQLAMAANPDLGRVPRLDRPADGRCVVWHYPDWRFRQATLYFQAWSSARARGVTWQMPAWENDGMVEDLLVFLAAGTCESRKNREVLSMVFQIQDHNETHGIGSRIKAYTVAGLIPDEIADRFSLDLDAVKGYLEVFFDVEKVISNRDRLATMVSGFASETDRGGTSGAKREASWIASAFLGGVDLLDICTGSRSDADDGDDAETARFVFSQMAAKAAEAAAYLRMGDAIPRKSHLEFYLEMNDVKSRVMQAQAQVASIEEERGKDDGHRRMAEFIDRVATAGGAQDFVQAVGEDGKSISLDALRTDSGRLAVEKMLNVEPVEKKQKKREMSLPKGVSRAS